MKKTKCQHCGSTDISVRNAYGNNAPAIGFAVEYYCKACGRSPQKSKVLEKIAPVLEAYAKRVVEEAKNMVPIATGPRAKK